jgi:hypothetical protein
MARARTPAITAGSPELPDLDGQVFTGIDEQLGARQDLETGR